MWPWQLGINGWIGILTSSAIALGVAIFLAVIAILAVRALSRPGPQQFSYDRSSDQEPIALRILDQRYERGEITAEEYLDLRRELIR
jgi:uncharacterized membrane protein